MRIYVDGVNADTPATIDGEPATFQYSSDNGMWYITIENITSRDIDRTYDVTIDGVDFEIGPYVYISNVLNSSNAPQGLKDLVTAIYWYGIKADEYFISIG